MSQRITTTTKRFLTACAAVGALAAPVAAHATPGGVAVDLGMAVLSSAVGYGVNSAFDEVLGAEGTNMMHLTGDALEQIEDIIKNKLYDQDYGEAQDRADLAQETAEDYFFSAQNLDASRQRVERAISDVAHALILLDNFELRGVPSYMMMAALDLQMKREAEQVETADGDIAGAEHYANEIPADAGEHLDYLDEMFALWGEKRGDIYPIYKRTLRTNAAGDKKHQKWCFDSEDEDANGEPQSVRHCNSQSWSCDKVSVNGSWNTTWDCPNTDDERAEVESLRWVKVDEARDRIFGTPEAFQRFRSELLLLSGRATKVGLNTHADNAVRALNDGRVHAKALATGNAGEFLLIDQDDGSVVFRTAAGKYLTSDLDVDHGLWTHPSNGKLNATATSPNDPAVRFTLVDTDDGRVHLRNADGRNVRAVGGGGDDVRCDTRNTGNATRFRLISVN